MRSAWSVIREREEDEKMRRCEIMKKKMGALYMVLNF
jgi:hypothetical protein